ncbi:unnamed protein product [Callosobruchus maculatus]|uniref:Uncharacterized protein n=1 Tax=Callosobruchus maculatus TaxID=64391 RepID=A0A653CDH9_CALMS|nr:unnamed protein product [Callosobruchus maculatus]
MWCRSVCLLLILGITWFANGHHLFDMKRSRDEIRPCIWIVVHRPPPPTHWGPTTTLAVENGPTTIAATTTATVEATTLPPSDATTAASMETPTETSTGPESTPEAPSA